MVELKEKTVEELRKMASRKKIEGRSKMNKAELVRALKKTTPTKKTMKRRKMRGGALTDELLTFLIRNKRFIFVDLYTNEDQDNRKLRMLARADNIYKVQGNDSVIVVELNEDLMPQGMEGVNEEERFIIIPKNLINLTNNYGNYYNLNIDGSWNYTLYNRERDGELIPNRIENLANHLETRPMGQA